MKFIHIATTTLLLLLLVATLILLPTSKTHEVKYVELKFKVVITNAYFDSYNITININAMNYTIVNGSLTLKVIPGMYIIYVPAVVDIYATRNSYWFIVRLKFLNMTFNPCFKFNNVTVCSSNYNLISPIVNESITITLIYKAILTRFIGSTPPPIPEIQEILTKVPIWVNLTGITFTKSYHQNITYIWKGIARNITIDVRSEYSNYWGAVSGCNWFDLTVKSHDIYGIPIATHMIVTLHFGEKSEVKHVYDSYWSFTYRYPFYYSLQVLPIINDTLFLLRVRSRYFKDYSPFLGTICTFEVDITYIPLIYRYSFKYIERAHIQNPEKFVVINVVNAYPTRLDSTYLYVFNDSDLNLVVLRLENQEKINIFNKSYAMVNITNIDETIKRISNLSWLDFYACPLKIFGPIDYCVKEVEEDSNYIYIYEYCHHAWGYWIEKLCAKILKNVKLSKVLGTNFPNVTIKLISINGKELPLNDVVIHLVSDIDRKVLNESNTATLLAEKNYTVNVFIANLPIAKTYLIPRIEYTQTIRLKVNAYAWKSYRNVLRIVTSTTKQFKVIDINRDYPYSKFNVSVYGRPGETICFAISKLPQAKTRVESSVFIAVTETDNYVVVCVFPSSWVNVTIIDTYPINITLIDTLNNVLNSSLTYYEVGKHVVKVPVNFMSFMFKSWKDGYTKPSRVVEVTKPITLIAIYRVPTNFMYVYATRFSENRLVVEGYLIDRYGNYLHNAEVTIHIENYTTVKTRTVQGKFKVEVKLPRDYFPTVTITYPGNDTYVETSVKVKSTPSLEYYIAPILPLLAITIAIILVIYFVFYVKKKK